ncbi:MAG: hypothetical protein WDN44_00890 [Sphingomonas sp.]
MTGIQPRGKWIALGGAVLLAAGGLGGAIVGGAFDGTATGEGGSSGSAAPSPAPSDSGGADVAAAKARCAELASDPNDPGRAAKPVPDDQMVPIQAIAACEAAVRLDPDDAQLRFEVGRAYWLARRNAEAVEQFATASDLGYRVADKFLGDAYFFGRGLPPGEERNFRAALDWYKSARDAGYAGAGDLVEIAAETIRRNTFDPSQFQNGELMKLAYEGRLEDASSPIALAFYLQGVVSRLDDEQTVFMDPKCKPLLNIIGNFVIENGQILAIAKVLAEKKDGLTAGIDFLAGSIYRDQGSRDGVILWDEDHYGCDSAVTKQIVNNIMVTLKDFR